MGTLCVRLALLLYELRQGPGLVGIARGAGLVLLVDKNLPEGVEVLADDRLIVLRDTGDPVLNDRRACAEIARAVCPGMEARAVAEGLCELLRIPIDE